jgi:hypothetical protein
MYSSLLKLCVKNVLRTSNLADFALNLEYLNPVLSVRPSTCLINSNVPVLSFFFFTSHHLLCLFLSFHAKIIINKMR